MLQQDLSGLTLSQKIALALMLVAIIFIIGVVVYLGPKADTIGTSKPISPPVVQQNVDRLQKINTNNSTRVRYSTGSIIYDSWWKVDNSGLIHQWRSFRLTQTSNPEHEHSTFKVISNKDLNNINRVPTKCSNTGEPFIRSLSWYYRTQDYTELGDDQGNLSDFVNDGVTYWVCVYKWID